MAYLYELRGQRTQTRAPRTRIYQPTVAQLGNEKLRVAIVAKYDTMTILQDAITASRAGDIERASNLRALCRKMQDERDAELRAAGLIL